MSATRMRVVHVVLAIVAGTILGLLGWQIAGALNEQKRTDDNSFLIAQTDFDPPPRPPHNTELTRAAVGPNGLIATHIDFYARQVGRYPKSLDELVSRPQDQSQRTTWRGPYLSNPRLLRDPWNRPYQYLCPGVHNPTGYDLWTTGPDGITSTNDDIGNW